MLLVPVFGVDSFRKQASTQEISAPSPAGMVDVVVERLRNQRSSARRHSFLLSIKQSFVAFDQPSLYRIFELGGALVALARLELVPLLTLKTGQEHCGEVIGDRSSGIAVSLSVRVTNLCMSAYQRVMLHTLLVSSNFTPQENG